MTGQETSPVHLYKYGNTESFISNHGPGWGLDVGKGLVKDKNEK